MDMSATPPSPARHGTAGRSPVRRRVVIAVVVVSVAAAVLAVAAATAGARGRLGPSARSWAQPGRSSAAGSAGNPTPAATAAPSGTPSPSSSAARGGCARKAGAPGAVKVTDVNVGVRVTGYGQEGDTDPLPMAIAAMPSGG